VVYADGLVLTVAHLIAQADEIAVRTLEGEWPATVVNLDLQRDLALLSAPGLEATQVESTRADVGDSGLIVGGAASGTIDYRVNTVANLSIEEVLGVDRSARLGYELEAEILSGDSGAGVYTAQDRLIGIVFAAADDGTWATAASEIEDFVSAERALHECDTDRSRMVETE